MARRRRRGLTEAERALWEQVRASARPLSGQAIPPTVAEEPAHEAPPGPAPDRPLTAPLKTPAPRQKADAPHPTGHDAPRMDRRRYEKLRRGRLEPDARVDLHGLTAERAHAALDRFIAGAHGSGKRLVLVITGKGRAPDGPWTGERGRGVLRHNVPLWLAMPPLSARVLQVAPAHPRHGGDGALYVYLRRQR
jgi:DNA-nicking Smr family endonuclease